VDSRALSDFATQMLRVPAHPQHLSGEMLAMLRELDARRFGARACVLESM
jgi:hypothetical protein